MASHRRLLIAGLCLCALVSGCVGATDASAPQTQVPVITVSGSGPYLVLLRELADAYPRRGEVEFEFVRHVHSGGGIAGVGAGEIDIAGVARPLSEEERQLAVEYRALSEDGMVIAVNPAVTISDITTQQVRDIYRGRVSDWSDLGGPELPVVILDRAEDESAKKALRQHVLGDTVVTSSTVALPYEEDMLKGVAQTPGAIGFLSLGLARSQGLQVQLPRLDGTEPSVDTIESDAYGFVRTLGMVLGADVAPHVRSFADWAGSPEAAALMREKGFAAARAAR